MVGLWTDIVESDRLQLEVLPRPGHVFARLGSWSSYFAGAIAEGETSSVGELERPREQLFPLNSRRLTAPILSRIVVDLRVPSGGSFSDTKQMVEGALNEQARQPQNVQVNLLELDEGVVVRLQDGDDIFMELPPGAEEGSATENSLTSSGDDSESKGERERRVESDPAAELRLARDKITELEDEVGE